MDVPEEKEKRGLKEEMDAPEEKEERGLEEEMDATGDKEGGVWKRKWMHLRIRKRGFGRGNGCT
jgi:hypothetical protein